MKNIVTVTLTCANRKDNPPCSESKTKIPRKNKTLKQKKKIKNIIIENLVKPQGKHTAFALHVARNFTENMPIT